MPEAVVHRRASHDGDGDRQGRSNREQQQRGALRQRQGAPERRDEGARDPADAQHQEDFRLLEREQRWHIAARHVGHQNGDAVEHLFPGLFEEVRKILHRAYRVEHVHDRPRPHQPHHQVSENQAGQQSEHEAPEPGACRAQAQCAPFGAPDQRHRRGRVKNRNPADHPRAERQSDADAGKRDSGRTRSLIFLKSAHEPEQQDRHRDRERRILGVHEHVPVIERA